MTTRPVSHRVFRALVPGVLALLLGGAGSVQALPTITSVVETGGDDSANTPAQFTGQAFNHPNLGDLTVGLFQERAPTYRDRTHQWTGAAAGFPLPGYLVDGEYIMIRNDNRDNPEFKLEVTVVEEALVYVLVDNRLTDAAAGDPPESGFSPEFWQRMPWLAIEGYVPVQNGLNRTADPTWPDEVGVDESADGSINNWSSVYFKQVPAGTFTLGEMNEGGRNMYGVVVKRLPQSINNPPEVTDLVPANNALFYPASSGLRFSASTIAPNRIDPAGIQLVLNGEDVSGGLVVGGNATARTAQFNQLQPNTTYRARITVSDQAGRATTRDLTFDTFDLATAFVIEAEDYNHSSGQVVAGTPPAGYEGLAGAADIDYHDRTAAAAGVYRTADAVGLATSSDAPRARFTDVGATDYQVNAFRSGDWMNYTRPFPDQTYQVYLRVVGSARQDVRLDRIVGDAGTVNQTTSTLGLFLVPSTAYTYVPLTDSMGNLVKVALNGATTLRLTALASANPTLQLNYLLLVPTDPARSPYVAAVSPEENAFDVAPDSVVQALLVQGSTTVAAANVTLTFDGNDVTSAAVVAATPDGWEITFDPPGDLALNTLYAVRLAYTDSAGTTFSNLWRFMTRPFAPVLTQVVETYGDDSDNTPAQFTRQSFHHPNLGQITVPTFREDVAAYRDRVHQWNGAATTLPLPRYLEGGDYVMIRNDNRDNLPFQLDLTVAEPARVYVLVDNRLSDGDAATPPDFTLGLMSWLAEEGWEPVQTGWNRQGLLTLPDEVGVDEGADGTGPGGGINNYASVYVRSVPAGMVSLFQADNSGRNMYGVVVRAVSTHPFVPTVGLTSPADGATYPTAPASVVLTAAAAVEGGPIAKVEFFKDATQKIGEVSSAPYTFTWNDVMAGRHRLTAKATAANGESAVSTPVEVIVGTVISVNFQATTAEVPVGYLADYGDVFGDRGNGYTYGWDADNTANARDRNSALSPDERWDTFNHWQKPLPAGQLWEIQIPNGRYSVHLVVGEASNFDSVYDVQVEGVTLIAGTPNTDLRWLEGTGTVQVTDGRLSIGNGPTAVNNKVCYVDIAALPPEAAPPVLALPTLSGGNLTVTWTGGGKLQEADDVAGPWTDVPGNPAGTYVTPATAARKFYRAVVP